MVTRRSPAACAYMSTRRAKSANLVSCMKGPASVWIRFILDTSYRQEQITIRCIEERSIGGNHAPDAGTDEPRCPRYNHDRRVLESRGPTHRTGRRASCRCGADHDGGLRGGPDGGCSHVQGKCRGSVRG